MRGDLDVVCGRGLGLTARRSWACSATTVARGAALSQPWDRSACGWGTVGSINAGYTPTSTGAGFEEYVNGAFRVKGGRG